MWEESEREREVHAQYRIADAKLQPAEEIGWYAAFGMGGIVYLKWGTVLGAIAAVGIAYYFITHSYRTKSNKAHKDYDELIAVNQED